MDEGHGEGRAEAEVAEDHEGRARADGDDEVADHGADVAAGAGDGRHAAAGGGLDEGDEAEAGAVGHGEEDGPHGEDAEGAVDARVVEGHGREADHEQRLRGVEEQLAPHAPDHAEARAHGVGDVAAERPREDVGQAEHRPRQPRVVLRHAVGLVEVEHHVLVHHQLDAEGEGVVEGQDPRPVVPRRQHERRPHRPLLLGRRDGDGAAPRRRRRGSRAPLEGDEVAGGAVVGEAEDDEAEEEHERRRADERAAPGRVVGIARGNVAREDDGVHGEGDPPAEVAPAGRGGDGQADDGVGEHGGGPERGGDEGAAREGDEEAHGLEARDVARLHHCGGAGAGQRTKTGNGYNRVRAQCDRSVWGQC